MIRACLYSLLLTLSCQFAFAWEGTDSISDPTSITPNPFQLSDIRPTFLKVSYRTLPAVSNYSYGEFQDVAFERNYLIDAELTLPVVFTKRLKLLAHLRHKNERLNLGEIEGVYDKSLNLKNSGVLFLYKLKLNEELFLAGHFGGALKTDQYQFQRFTSILDFNSSIVVGKENDLRNKRIAFGVILGNSLGRFQIAPLFIYDKQFNRDWMLEMKLPKEVIVRRIVKSDNFYLIGAVEATGAAYFLSSDVYPGDMDIEYRRTAIEFRLGLEKEIHDWLWFGVDAGITQPIRSSLVTAGDASRNSFHDFGHQFTPFVNLSIFAVPPRKLIDRLKN